MDNSRRVFSLIAGVLVLAGYCRPTATSAAYEPFNYPVGSGLVGQTNQIGEYWTAEGTGASQVAVVAENLARSNRALRPARVSSSVSPTAPEPAHPFPRTLFKGLPTAVMRAKKAQQQIKD